MLGDLEEWFYRGLGGIDVDFSRAAPRQLMLHPQILADLKWVRSSYVSAWGPIESNRSRGPEQTEYEFAIPANATATVELTSTSPEALTVNGAAPGTAPGVIGKNIRGNKVELEVGSGHYKVIAKNPMALR
jgi:alpha-L-rhamnosidase